MVPYEEYLSQERKVYYNCLSNCLTRMCYAAVNAGDWERVIECAKQHLELNWCAEFDGVILGDMIDAKLRSISHFCLEDGWV